MNVRSPVIVSEPDLAAHSLKASPLSLTPAVWSNQSESCPSQLLANFAGLRFLFSEWLLPIRVENLTGFLPVRSPCSIYLLPIHFLWSEQLLPVHFLFPVWSECFRAQMPTKILPFGFHRLFWAPWLPVLPFTWLTRPSKRQSRPKAGFGTRYARCYLAELFCSFASYGFANLLFAAQILQIYSLYFWHLPGDHRQ